MRANTSGAVSGHRAWARLERWTLGRVQRGAEPGPASAVAKHGFQLLCKRSKPHVSTETAVLAIGPSRLNADVGMLAGSSSWKWKWIPRSVVDRDTLSRRGRQTILAKPMTQVLILFFWRALGLYHSQMNMGRCKVLGHGMYPVM